MSARILAVVFLAGCGAGLAVEDPADGPPPPSAPLAVPPDAALPDTVIARDAGTPAEAASAPAPSPDRPQTGVPMVHIDVGGKAILPDVKTAGRIRIVEQGAPVLDSALGIEVRGTLSATFDKKSFGIELRDDAGAERAAAVLGMPAETDWVLYASYSDKTYLRNALTYALGRELGRYNPRTRFVELTLDGQYRGVYLVVEKIKRDKNRVDIPESAFIFKKEREGKPEPERNFTAKTGTVYSYHYPRHDRITAAQRTALAEMVDRFEALWATPGWARGYRSAIDVGSWVDYAVACELSFNPDCYRKSFYLHTRGAELVAHPLWDFDLGYDNSSLGRTADFAWSWLAKRYEASPLNIRAIFYWPQLWSDPAFQTDFKCRWQALRKGLLAEAGIRARIDAWVKLLGEAEKRDHTRWPVLNTDVVYSQKFPTWNQHLDQLRGWIDARLRWLDPAVAKLPGACAS